MGMKTYRIAPDVKAQIISRIKNDGIPVAQAAKEHGISDQTIYNWLGRRAEGGPTVLAMAKLRRENAMLKELVGEITLKLSETQKKK
jgi:transposase-like protein